MTGTAKIKEEEFRNICNMLDESTPMESKMLIKQVERALLASLLK